MTKMSRVRLTLVGVLVMLALGAVPVTAQAEGGPTWKTKEFGELKGPAETRAVSSTSLGTEEFKLKTPTATIACKKEIDTGNLIGGNPGTGTSLVTFKECSVEGKTVAQCGAKSIKPAPRGGLAGEVETAVKIVLGYPNGNKESLTKAEALLIPEGVGSDHNLFVEFELTGTMCGTLNNKKVKVKATGTEVTVPAFKRKCGVTGEVGKVAAGVFARTGSGEEFTEGALNFKGPTATDEVFEGAATWKKIECKLEAFSETAEEIGLSKVETLLEPEPFGWVK